MIEAVALDLGSTTIKAALMDHQGNLSRLTSKPAPTTENHDGRYECSALDYVETAELVLKACIGQMSGKPPLGICCQRSSFLIWNRATGTPLTPLISWQDDRGASSCERLQPSADIIGGLTGLRLTPYYFAPKLNAMLRQNPNWYEKLVRGEWLVGTLDTFLIWRWTREQHFIVDASMAARMLLMDIHTQQWSEALCDLFEIPSSILPRIVPSMKLSMRLINGLTLQASVGDQSAALLASLGNNPTEALVNLGTGGFVIRTLAKGESAFDGYLQTLIYQNDKLQARFAVEGTINSIAAALAPYPVNDCHVEDLAQLDIYCLAEPSGLGAPYFRADWGIHFSQSIADLNSHQIAALLLEAIIFRVVRMLEKFHQHAAISQVFLSGGLSALSCLQSGIAQCVSLPVYHLEQQEASLQGAALLAADLRITYRRKARRIEANPANIRLMEKYRRWRIWLDAILKTDQC